VVFNRAGEGGQSGSIAAENGGVMILSGISW
jgi:hypothetical protein